MTNFVFALELTAVITAGVLILMYLTSALQYHLFDLKNTTAAASTECTPPGSTT